MAPSLWRVEIGRFATLLASRGIWAGNTEQVGPCSPRLSPKSDIGKYDPGAVQHDVLCMYATDNGIECLTKREDHAIQLQRFPRFSLHCRCAQCNCMAIPREVFLLCFVMVPLSQRNYSCQFLSTGPIYATRSTSISHVQLVRSRRG